jgi:putative hydrolase of the HAD superfamily
MSPAPGPIEVVLFDFFGTLVTYEPDRTVVAYPRTHDLIAGWGSIATHDQFVEQWDTASTALEQRSAASHEEHSMLDIAAEYASSVGLQLDSLQLQQLVDVFLVDWRVGVHGVPDAADMVNRLHTAHRLGVVSNTYDPAMVPSLLDELGMADAFDFVLLSVDHGHRKPHPSIYERALTMCDCPPALVAFVGDTYEPDYVGPIAAGMSAYLIDPMRLAPVPEPHRLHHVLDIEGKLRP